MKYFGKLEELATHTRIALDFERNQSKAYAKLLNAVLRPFWVESTEYKMLKTKAENLAHKGKEKTSTIDVYDSLLGKSDTISDLLLIMGFVSSRSSTLDEILAHAKGIGVSDAAIEEMRNVNSASVGPVIQDRSFVVTRKFLFEWQAIRTGAKPPRMAQALVVVEAAGVLKVLPREAVTSPKLYTINEKFLDHVIPALEHGAATPKDVKRGGSSLLSIGFACVLAASAFAPNDAYANQWSMGYNAGSLATGYFTANIGGATDKPWSSTRTQAIYFNVVSDYDLVDHATKAAIAANTYGVRKSDHFDTLDDDVYAFKGFGDDLTKRLDLEGVPMATVDPSLIEMMTRYRSVTSELLEYYALSVASPQMRNSVPTSPAYKFAPDPTRNFVAWADQFKGDGVLKTIAWADDFKGDGVLKEFVR